MSTLRPLRLLSLVMMFVLLAGSLALAVPPDYLIFDIGTVEPGSAASQGFAASPLVGIATGASSGSIGQAFTWTRTEGLIGLPNLASRNYCRGNGVNDLGVVVGTGATTFYGSGALPLIWSGGAVAQLPLPAGQSLGRAEDINNDGVAVGSVDGGSLQRGAVFSGGSAYVVTATTSTGCYVNTFYAVNDAGLAVGSGWDPANAARTAGFVYDINTNTAFEVDLLPGLNSALNFAVSNAGHVAGVASINSGAGSVPFIWSQTGGSTAIPVPAGTSNGSARGVNSAGWVVGIASNAYAIPFLYDGDNTYRIADLLPAGSGWDVQTNTSSSAMGISDNGVIVGTGLHDGEIRAYAMVPDDAVAAVLQQFAAQGRDDGIAIQWGLAFRDESHTVTLERATSEYGPWQVIETATALDASLLDETAAPGQTYHYRLSITDTSGDSFVLGMITAERTTVGLTGVTLGVPAPNPTRGTTSAAYRLPAQQNVRITVHDVRGRLVRTIVDNVVAGGEHVMQWDGHDDHGVRSPAGMYFINMRTEQSSRTQRVVLTR